MTRFNWKKGNSQDSNDLDQYVGQLRELCAELNLAHHDYPQSPNLITRVCRYLPSILVEAEPLMGELRVTSFSRVQGGYYGKESSPYVLFVISTYGIALLRIHNWVRSVGSPINVSLE